MKKPKVLVIGPSPLAMGGVASFISNILKQEELASKYQVMLHRTGHRNEEGSAPFQLTRDLRDFVEFLIQSKFKGAKITHLHTSSYWSFFRNVPYAFVVRYLSDSALIIHIHGGRFGEFYAESSAPIKRMIRSNLNRADRLIVTSPTWIQIINKICKSEMRIDTVSNGFDPDIFKVMNKNQARAEIGLPTGKHLMISIGYYEEVKGFRYLIEAMAKVAKKRDEIGLYIIGTGPLKSQMESLIDELGLRPYVFLVAGGKSPTEISKWICASDMMVIPSLNEGSPVVMFESLGCGRPVIGTRVGGIPDVINEPYLGRLSAPRNAQELSDSIAEALEVEWDEDRINGYAQRFTWKAIASELDSIYASLVR
jgi:teichuronic acid biosynthesis glycosyltransferase TuaC